MMEKMITDKFKELSENGKVEEIITKHVIDFVNSTVRDCLSSYGDVSKAFKKKLENNILEGFERLDFVQYSKLLTDTVEHELNNSIMEIAIAPVKEMIAGFVGSLEKKEWHLSEIIEEFKEMEVISKEYGESGVITFHHKKSEYGSEIVYFDQESSQLEYRCDYRLMIDSKTKKIFSIQLEQKHIHPMEQIQLTGFPLFLYKLYAMGCTIELDKVDTYWSTYDN